MKDYPEIDVFRVKSLKDVEYKPHKIIAELRRLSGFRYGWGAIYRLVKWRLINWRKTPIIKEGYMCSNVIALALEKHYADLVPFKPWEYVTPADLSRCALLEYKFTIKESDDQRRIRPAS
jgi:hypothetical protein